MKKLIIVCEERLRHYGDFLAQLISATDDAEGGIIGIKDGSAVAQVWTEKEYTSNAPQISSEQYILFIGNSKLIKDKRLHMQKKYSEYGMNYGWLGKQGALFVDRTVSYSEYEAFYKLACQRAVESRQSELPKLIENKDSTNESKAAEAVIDTEYTEIENTEENETEITEPIKDNKFPKVLVPVGKGAKNISRGAVTLFRKTADFGTKQINNLTVVTKSKEIENQEYTCLVMIFYLRDLGNFLGLGE